MAFGLAIAFAVGQLILFAGASFAINALADVFSDRRAWEDTLGHPDPWREVPGLIFWVVFVWAHALFVLMVSDASRPGQRYPNGLITVLAASVPLGLIFLTFSVLDSTGAAYGCAEGRAFRHNDAIPMLPWVWIGWLSLTLFAIPTRLLAWVRKVRLALMPIWLRAALLPLGALPVWIFGYVFQNRVIDCSRPHEGWGFMEGGLVLAPLFGAFLFATCTSMAMLSAAFVKPAQR